MEEITASEAAKLLDIPINKLKMLEKQGLIHSVHNAGGMSFYSSEEIGRIKPKHAPTLSEEAAQVGIAIQRETAFSVAFMRKMLMLAGGVLSGYILLVVVFTGLFIVTPLQAAQWTGLVPKSKTNTLLTQKPQDKRVLAAETSLAPGRTSPVETILKPIGKTSLGIVKSISPDSYAKVSEVVIIDPNDILELDTNGAIVPERPISIPKSSLLKVETSDLVANLNSNYVQGRQPGTNAGDLAIVGETVAPIPATVITEITDTAISGLTNENLSGSAGISNDNLATPDITIDTEGPLSGGGLVSLGETLTLDCPTCVTTDNDSLFTADSTDTLTNKTIDAGSNTVTNLTAASLEAGDFSSKITSGTYSINITGSVSSATNFTGSLAGDVTGTQGSTTVEKINGNTLGLTTPTAGNFLIGDGSSWITQAISNDATIDSSGALTLKNVGTPGSYGSATLIPVITTDAQGRVSGVTDTAISGLTISNFGSAGISQWTNDSGYITDGNTNWDNSYGLITDGNTGWDNSYGFITSADDTVSGLELDGVFSSTGILVRTGATTYSTITDNSSNWDTAFSHSGATTNVHGLTFTAEGTGGGLDADTVDGQDATAFATAGHNHDGSYLTGLSVPSDLGDIDGDFTSGLTVEDDSHAHTTSTISGLTNSNLSGSAGITNANLANSSLTVTAGSGLANGGLVSLGGSTTIDIGAGSGIQVNSNDIAIKLATTAGVGSTASLSGLEVDSDGLRLLNGCGQAEILVWDDANNVWECASIVSAGGITGTGTDNYIPRWDGTNGLSSSVIYQTDGGLVGIGTTAPSFSLSAVGSTSSGNIASITNLNATDSATSSVLRLNMGTTDGSNTLSRFIQFVAGATTDNNGSGVGNIKIQNSGVQYVSGNADLAEWTDVSETVADGDIIASLSSGNQKAVEGNLLLGVVTDTAAFVGNETEDLTGQAIVGMLGRVNTKVSTENGNIAKGDPITASSVAGVGMKQTKAGPTIGKALAPYSSIGVSRIAVQVIPGWYDPDPLLNPSSFTISGPDVLDQNSEVVARVGGFHKIFLGELAVADNLTLESGALNLTATSGALILSGLSASSISTGTNDLTITSANFNTTSTGINSTAIGATSPSTGSFSTLTGTTINGLTVTNNGTNTLNIASGKTLGVNNSITFAGTDGTTFSFPTTADDIVGLTVSQTLINKTISAGSNTISGLTDANLSGSAGITNTNLANSALTITAGSGLINGGSVPLGGSTVLDIGAGNGITVNADDLAINLTTSGTTGSTSSSSGMEVSSSGLTLLKGCADNEILKWTDAGGWACSPDQTGNSGSDLQHAASYDTDQGLVNVASSQVTLGTVSVTPATSTGDVYVTGFAEVRSGNNTDQAFNIVIETTNNCTGSTVGNATVTYTITAGANGTIHYGNIRVSGIAVDPGTSAQPYSLCASTATGDTDVLNWGIEATVIDTGADLAEIYTTNDNDIEVGDVVSIDPDLKTGMKKSQTLYDNNVIGVVSTRPGLVIGGIDNEGVNAMPVALSGRVPVKVSTQNGTISAGDYLTTSSIPGVAVKATEAGAIIGIAMSSYDEENVGQILVFVKNGSSAGQNNNGENYETEENSITEQITQIVSDLFKNTMEFFGSVIFHSDVTFAGRPTFNSDTAGHASIDKDDSEVEITFDNEYEQKPIVTVSVNLEGETNIDDVPKYAIYDLSTKGFKIKLSETTDTDMNFSWVALSVNNDE